MSTVKVSNLLPLSQWMKNLPVGTFAQGLEHEVSQAQFYRDVAKYQHALAAYSGARWALYHSDTYLFTVILCALWQLRRTVCIPGDNCESTQRRLEGEVDGFIGEFRQAVVLEQSLDSTPIPEFELLETDFRALEVYTSGSTGEPKAIVKTVAQLESEIATLQRLWPNLSDVVSTVSHQHFYGLIFRVFWPISSGRKFFAKTCRYTEEVQSQAARCEHFSLVSSPTHLSRFTALLDWPELAASCEAVFSSAAPLKKCDSHRMSGLLRAPVFEVYGSSETGAIAWRRQTLQNSEALWQALPQVELSVNSYGLLCCRSSYNDSSQVLELSDKVLFTEQGFSLLGRVDRIVKVEGKRLSLSSMEQKLETLSQITAAKTLVLQNKRTEVAAVITLSESGIVSLLYEGKRALVKRLKQQLACDFEAVLLPRRWRFVDKLPYNSQGKLVQSNLELMFEKQLNKWPQISAVHIDEMQLTIHFKPQVELIYFDGHFAGNPILPGVVQIHWAQAFAKEHLGIEGCFSHLEKVKFQKVIQPLDAIELSVSFDTGKHRLQFCYCSEKGDHSSGYICFKD